MNLLESEFLKLVERDHLKNVQGIDLTPKSYQNIYITNSGLCLKGLRSIPETFFLFISKKRYKGLYRYALIKRFREKKIKPPHTVSTIHHIWSSGYHHWLTECLLKALYLDTDKDHIYLPENYPDYCKESLIYLGFKNIHSLPIGTGIKAKKAKLVPNPISGLEARNDLNLIRNRFKVDSNLSGKRKIYISRANAALRKIINEDELITLLNEKGYEIINSEHLSFIEQVELYKNTQVLISNHGAGLTNCLFMPSGSIVFEIYREMENDNDYMNLCYYRMAKSLEHKYCIQFGKRISDGTSNIDRQNIEVNANEFKLKLEKIESLIK